MLRLVGLPLLACVGVLGASASSAFGIAMHVPIDPTSPLFIPLGPIPPGVPGVTVDPNCPPAISTAFAAFEFVDGNGHVYGPLAHPLTNGANVEGNAFFLGLTDPTDPTSVAYAYAGQGHAWFGSNNFPNPMTPDITPGPNAQVSAQTFSFHGVGVNGTPGSLDVQGSFGQTQSASGHQSGWGHLKVTC
ncbi:MAG TPA: hypothetical protein VKR22_01085 [Acidimicrobiales bacterium]|nr:hypothetical protein [Acidimicrobiales bacterium]